MRHEGWKKNWDRYLSKQNLVEEKPYKQTNDKKFEGTEKYIQITSYTNTRLNTFMWVMKNILKNKF